jgi:hypothetical protein
MAIRRTRGILALARKYGPVIMEAASARALTAERYAYPYVKHLCQDLALKGGDPQPTLTQHDDLIRTGAEYQRFVEDSVAQQQEGLGE